MRSEKKQRALSQSGQIRQTNENTGGKTKKAGSGCSRLTLLTGVEGYFRFLLSAPPGGLEPPTHGLTERLGISQKIAVSLGIIVLFATKTVNAYVAI